MARPRTPSFLPQTATEIELEAGIGIELEAEIGIETATEIEIELEAEAEVVVVVGLLRPPAPPISQGCRIVPIALFAVCS